MQVAASQQRIRIFSPKLETVNLALGVFFAVSCFATWIFVGRVDTKPFYQPTHAFILNFLALNITHNAFSFLFPLFMPEFRQWWRDEKRAGLSMPVWIALVVLFFFLILFGLGLLQTIPRLKHVGVFGAGCFVDFWALRHVIGQTSALGRLYDMAHREAGRANDPKTDWSIRWQRRLTWWIFYPLLCIKAAAFYVYSGSTIQNIVLFTSLTMVAIALVIIVLAYREAQGRRSNKWIFFCRLLPYCCFSLNPFALYSNMIMHSFEYASLFGRMVENSDQASRQRHEKIQRYWLASIAIVFTIIALGNTRYFLFGPHLKRLMPNHIGLIEILATLSVTLSLTHYHLDNLMFKFSAEGVRKRLLPLMRTGKPAD